MNRQERYAMLDHRHGEYLEAKGTRIYFEECGKHDGPALLLLHGGFGTLEDFNAVIPALTKQFRVIGIDSRGHGRSMLGSQPLTYEQLQLDALAVLNRLDVESAHILGFSDGGIVGYRIAAFACERVEKLLTIGAAWQLRRDDPLRELYAKITGDSWRKKFPETYETYQRLNPAADFDALARAAVQMWLDPSTSGYPNQAAKRICCPLLIVRGEKDHLFSMDDAVELERMVNGAKLAVVPNAGHEAHKEQTTAVVKLIEQFFSDNA